MVQGLVQGILEGNRMVRDKPRRDIDVVAKAFKWSEDEARDELAQVHLSNLPENLAFFSGTIDAAGCFGGIYQSAVLAYGSVIKDPPDAERFADPRRARRAREDRPVQGSEDRDRADPQRDAAHARRRSAAAARTSASSSSRTPRRSTARTSRTWSTSTDQALLQVSPGSTVLLRGHVDNARVDEFRKQGGEAARADAWRSRRWSCRSSAPASIRRSSSREPAGDPTAHRSGRPRLGRAGQRSTRTRTGASRCSGSRSRARSRPRTAAYRQTLHAVALYEAPAPVRQAAGWPQPPSSGDPRRVGAGLLLSAPEPLRSRPADAARVTLSISRRLRPSCGLPNRRWSFV